MKKIAKHSLEKINSGFNTYRTDSDPKIRNDIVNNVISLYNILKENNIKKKKQVEKVNNMIYNDPVVSKMMKIMCICDQVILNAISSLLQVTVLKFPDNSLPLHFENHPADLDQLFYYFNDLSVGSTAHIIFRACISRNREFTDFVFKKGYVLSFFQFLVDENFDKVGPAFASYDALLNTYIDISAEQVAANWNVYHNQFKVFFHSNSYIILSYFLGIFYKFMNTNNCKTIAQKFIEDPENLIITLKLLISPKRRISVGAYNIFKLFTTNARRSRFIMSVLKENKRHLISVLENYTIPDVPAIQEQLDDEHDQMLDVIRNMK